MILLVLSTIYKKSMCKLQIILKLLQKIKDFRFKNFEKMKVILIVISLFITMVTAKNHF